MSRSRVKPAAPHSLRANPTPVNPMPVNPMPINEGKSGELMRGLLGFVLGAALGALVGMLAKRKPDDSRS